MPASVLTVVQLCCTRTMWWIWRPLQRWIFTCCRSLVPNCLSALHPYNTIQQAPLAGTTCRPIGQLHDHRLTVSQFQAYAIHDQTWTQITDSSVAEAVACQIPDHAAACSLVWSPLFNQSCSSQGSNAYVDDQWRWVSGNAENFRCSRHRTTGGRREFLVSCRFNLAVPFPPFPSVQISCMRLC